MRQFFVSGLCAIVAIGAFSEASFGASSCSKMQEQGYTTGSQVIEGYVANTGSCQQGEYKISRRDKDGRLKYYCLKIEEMCSSSSSGGSTGGITGILERLCTTTLAPCVKRKSDMSEDQYFCATKTNCFDFRTTPILSTY